MSQSTTRTSRPDDGGGTPEHRHRGRLLVVGDVDLAESVWRETPRPVTVVSDFYEAMGELATTELASAPDAVIGTVSAFGKNPSEFVDAIRSLDPSISVLAIADDSYAGDEWTLNTQSGDAAGVESIVDAVLTFPVSRLELERAIQQRSRRAPASTASEPDDVTAADSNEESSSLSEPAASETPPTPPTPATPPTPTVTAAPADEPVKSAASADAPMPIHDLAADDESRDVPTSQPPISPSTSISSGTNEANELEPDVGRTAVQSTAQPEPHENDLQTATTPAMEPPGTPDTGLGGIFPSGPARPVTPESGIEDADLIDHLIQSPESAPTLFELAIMARAGANEIHIERGSEATVGEGGAAVTYRGEQLGVLRSPDLDPPALRKWAEWIGGWMGLAAHMDDLRMMAYTDDLTDAWNRRFLRKYLEESLEQARQRREFLSVLIFDLDDFKSYNDSYGHDCGDEILIETVHLLKSVVRNEDRVCRIGGDEFAVIFYDPTGNREPGSQHPETVEDIAQRFQEQISRHRFPKLGTKAPGRLTISGGMATFPWDGLDRDSLLNHADQALMAAKQAGKNAVVFGS